MATRANRTADDVHGALPSDWRADVRLASQEIEQILLALFERHAPDNSSAPSPSYELTQTGNGLLVGKTGEGQQKEVNGNAGRLGAFASLRDAEGKPFPGHWGHAFSSHAEHPRFHGVKNEFKRTMNRLCPELEYQIERVQGTRQEESLFAATHNRKVQLNSPAYSSAAKQTAAVTAYRDGDVEKALELTVAAIRTCPLYLPAYGVLQKCLQDPDTLAAFTSDETSVRLVVHAIRKITIWHVELRASFDFTRIPAEQHEAVREECLWDIDARLTLLDNLLDLIRGADSFASIPPVNPVNSYLLQFRRGQSVALTEAENRLFDQLLDGTAETVKDDSRFRSFADGVEPADWPHFVTRSLRSTLNDLAADAHFVFPEPEDETDGKWRRKTVVLWVKRLFNNPHNRSRDVPLQAIEAVLSDDFDGTTPVSPVSKRRSDHPGKNDDS